MPKKPVLTCAVTGAGDTTSKNEHVPVTPKEIAESAIAAAKAGATVAHVHARDPETGGVSHDVEHYREIVTRIREADVDVIVNITSGGGGDLVLNAAAPTQGAAGTDIQTPEERHAPVKELLPEMCSLDCGSVNMGDMIYVNPAHWVRHQAKLIQESGVKPEIECFDTGHIHLSKHLIQEGLIDGTPLYQFCLGIPWGAEADIETLVSMKNKIPENAEWSAFGIGRIQFPIVAHAALMGGNVRVGLEDNLYLKKGVLATNEQLVDKAVNLLGHFGMEPMTPAEARDHYNLINPASK